MEQSKWSRTSRTRWRCTFHIKSIPHRKSGRGQDILCRNMQPSEVLPKKTFKSSGQSKHRITVRKLVAASGVYCSAWIEQHFCRDKTAGRAAGAAGYGRLRRPVARPLAWLQPAGPACLRRVPTTCDPLNEVTEHDCDPTTGASRHQAGGRRDYADAAGCRCATQRRSDHR